MASSTASTSILLIWGAIVSVVVVALAAAEARAPAGDQRKYRTAYACEGSTLTLSCGDNNSGEVINLLRANYGRFSITICNEHGDTDWSVNCMSHRSLRALHAKCNQQTNCSILASTNVFGDPCPGTLKYLEAHYQCVPAAPASSTARPRPPWFSSVGPSIWNTLGLQNATASTVSGPASAAVTTEASLLPALETAGRISNATSAMSNNNSTAVAEQNGGSNSSAQAPSSTTAASSSTSASTTTSSTTSSTTTTPSTTTQHNLLVELSEVTVLVPDFPGRRPQSSTTTPAPTTQVVPSVDDVDDADQDPEMDVDLIDQDESGLDQEEGLLTTPGSSTIAPSNSGRPRTDKSRPPGHDHAAYCQPAVTRGLYWNWTKSGDPVVQPCPGGATGYARWFCGVSESGSGAAWYPSSPDLSECKSVWLTSLDSRIGEGDSIISIANDLAQVTHSKTLYGGDMMAAARLLRQMAIKMAADLQAFPDWRQREAIVTELVQSVVRAGSSLLGSSQSLAWRDLGLSSAASAGRPAPATPAGADEVVDQHYMTSHQRDLHARTTATALLTGLEENAFLLANTISRQKSVFQSYDNILMSVRVMDTRSINELSFPSTEELQVWKSKEDWIVLPSEALLENSDGGLVRVVLFAYEHMEDILSPNSIQHHHHLAQQHLQQSGGSVSSPNRHPDQLLQHHQLNATRIVNSRVISASLGKGRHIQLPQPVTIRFQHLRQDNVSNPTCVFWDYTISGWSDEGCRVLTTNRTHTQCRCDHLTNFAVLMDLHSTPLTSLHQRALAAITYAGCGLSILCLAAAVAVFFVCHRQLKSDRYTIHKNLCLSLLLAEIVFLSGINSTGDRIVCGLVAGLLHLFFLCAFMWMLLEGFQLYVMLVEVFESDKSRVKWYYLCGYGVPVLIVAVSSVVDPFSYGTLDYCWLRADNYFVFSFVGPVILILIANLVFLGLAIWVMYRHQTTSAVMKSKEQSRLTNARGWIKGSFVLVFLLGLTWTFGLLYLNESTVAMAYVFTILNSLQGLFIFFFLCVQNDQVRKEVRRALRRHGCLSAECLSTESGLESNTSSAGLAAPGGMVVGKDNLQTSFYGSSAPTLTHGESLTATYMAQPWRAATDHQTGAVPQVNNNMTSSMRLNNTKNSQMRASSRTLKQQPLNGQHHETENGSYKSYGRDSGNGSSEQDDSSPRQQQMRAQQQQQQQATQQQIQLQQQQQQQQQQAHQLQVQQQQGNGSMNRSRGNNYPHPVPNPALAECAAMDAQQVAHFDNNCRASQLRLAHHHHHGANSKRSRSASPWNHTYMEIDMRRGIRKTLTEEGEEESGLVDPVYEEIEKSAGCGGGDQCPCNHQRPTAMHYQQASDLSDEERRQNSSDVSRQSSRSYGDSRPLIPLHPQQQGGHHHHNHHHHHQHSHQLSTQSQPSTGTQQHDLLTTISCAFNSPHLRTKHRHPFDAGQQQQQVPIHMGFEGAPHFDAERYSQRPTAPYPTYNHHQEGLTALNLMNGERIFVASGAVLEQRSPQPPASVIQRPIPFTEC